MAKFEQVSEETKKIFEDVIEKSNIPNWVEFELLCNNKQKKLYKILKLNDLIETITEGINFIIVIDEGIFEKLSIDQQKLVFVESIAGISISENDKLSLEKPNFTTHIGVLEKYGHEEIIMLNEVIKSLYDEKKQKEDEEKVQKKKKSKY